MARYTSRSKERVREAVDFVALVSARTDLRRAGPSRYEGLCPFHDERTPSFGIDPIQKVYYCFGCQAAGDVFTFVQETEHLDFKGALELLAERAGIELELEREDPREAELRKRRERLSELLSRTAAYYQRVLWESREAARAREYLDGRGLGREVLERFAVGFAPSAWDKVLLASLRAGFSEAELLATGLAQRSKENGRPYDRFRKRIMFPLADIRGRTVGFGARAMGEGQRPKYLNSAENEIYHKGRHLYGAQIARAEAAKRGTVVLCEGYTDVVALHQAGVGNAVGLMGTALTERQLAELARMASTVLLALDADAAGQEAMMKASKLAAKRKLELRVVRMPGGMDPAELIQREGPPAIAAALEESVPFVRFMVDRILAAGDTRSPEGRDRTVAALAPVFTTIPPSAIRLDLIRLVSGTLSLPESLLEGMLSSASPAAGTSGGRGPTAASRSGVDPRAPAALGGSGQAAGRPSGMRRPLARRVQAERAFLALCLAVPDLGAEALARLGQDRFTDPRLADLAERLRKGDLSNPMPVVEGGGRAGDRPGDRVGDGQDGAPSAGEGSGGADPPGDGQARSGEDMRGLLAELIVEAGRHRPDGERPSGALQAMLAVSELQLELAHIDRQIRAAKAGGGGEVAVLAKRRLELHRAFDAAQEHALEQSGA